MFSNKVEDIPSQNYKDLETSLSELNSSNASYFTRSLLSRKSGVSESKVLVFLTDLCERGVLSANIEVRCPDCDQDHGRYEQKNQITSDPFRCFCGAEFNPSERAYWEVVYQITNEENDFFPDLKSGLKQLIESADSLPPDFFENKFKEVENIEDNKKRGRVFDYLIGLLFNQLPDVKVFIGHSVPIGEIDVFVTCLDSPNWLHRLVGEALLIENKWAGEPIQTREISVFHDKVSSAPTNCKLSYFVSMSGFTHSGEISAKQLIRNKSDPKMVGIERNDVERMVEDGTPEQVLRSRVMR